MLGRIRWAEQHGCIRVAGVLHAPVTVMQQAAQRSTMRLAAFDHHRQRIHRQRGPEVTGHRVADHTTGVQVKHHRQVQPAFAGRHVRQVSHSRTIRLRLGKLSIQAIWRHAVGVIAVGGSHAETPFDL